MSGLAEAVEMATLDKEMAEEKCDILQQDVDQLKQRIEELETDIAILREETERKGATGVGGHDDVSLKQLQAQNERMKKALFE